MTLGQSTLTVLTLVSLVCAIVAIAIAVGQGQRLRHLRRSYSIRQRSVAPLDDGYQGSPDVELADLREAVVQSIRHVSVVRFDAFDDMGGKLSFAVALLDEEGSGVIFSAINGRNETRVYAKAVERGASRITLADEETEAIRRAMAGVRA